MDLFNFALARNPINWFIVFTMLLIWVFAFDLLHAYMTGREPSEAAATN